MTRWEHAESRQPSAGPDVVAGMLPGPSAAKVAKTAVTEAASRGGRVRFLQVLGGNTEEKDSGEASTFAAALKALREVPGVPVSFEVSVGEPGRVIVERSRGAALLVIGGDDPDVVDELRDYCVEHAPCEVLTVHPAGEPVA
ncbi:MAG: universal stress protein [Mobilicoccus sp.]|nr:universal stress protein [Mobilicoccus sp.]